MLILSRRVNERILIGDDIEVFIVDIKGDQVKVGIKAPREVKVYRQEVLAEILAQNIEASRAEPRELPEIRGLMEGREP